MHIYGDIAEKNYYGKKHIDEFFGVAADTSKITDWLLTEEAEEVFSMKHSALRAYAYRHKIRTGKTMQYNPEDRHRIKEEQTSTVNWIHSILKNQQILPEEWQLSQCLFEEPKCFVCF